jgi:hypothetical protein
MRALLATTCLLSLSLLPTTALDYPGAEPGKAKAKIEETTAFLENAVLRAEWTLEDKRISSFTFEHKQTGQLFNPENSLLPRIVLADDRSIVLGPKNTDEALRLEGQKLMTTFRDEASGLSAQWSVQLEDENNTIIQTLQLTATEDTRIESLLFLDATIPEARQVGTVDGSVVVCDGIFMAIEHPLAKNTARDGKVHCGLPRGNVLQKGQSWTYTFVFGVTPPNQLRRGFLYYLERRRAQPYRPFLHYNNWYDVILARKKNRITEEECLQAMEVYRQELVEKRGVQLDAFVWDDGWDDFNTLWGFHDGFPQGFQKLSATAKEYGASMGVWMSPWGGYATAKAKRIAYGKTQGYETNESGFSMAGRNYQQAFLNVCLQMMRNHGVTFFKFDGMGGGNRSTGAEGGLADDIDAVLQLTRTLRAENPEVFISATVGTWASPFWTLYADSIWRQGDDINLFGEGDTRQQWITYRDMFCYERIVQLGPLYPLNSVMLLGPAIGNRQTRAPSKMVLEEKSVADEIWSFFGAGTNLQELYVSPDVPTPKMWDHLAEAAKWARRHQDILVDTHWIGGNPRKGEIYGWASWNAGQGTLTLRNPSTKEQTFQGTLKKVFELASGENKTISLHVRYPEGRALSAAKLEPDQALELKLQPFEVVVIEAE